MNMKKKTHRTKEDLQMYVFWTGFLSTFISLIHVIVIALK